MLILTMGFTTGLYAAAESILFRPWPVHEPHRVVAVNINRLYGVSPRDPIAYAVVLAVLAAAAILAAWIPARRALRVDPAVTLRAE